MKENDNFHKKCLSEHARKVACPQCRARLFDINPDKWECKAIVMHMGAQTSFDISEKCPKCKALVGISLERKQTQLRLKIDSNQLSMCAQSLYPLLLSRLILL